MRILIFIIVSSSRIDQMYQNIFDEIASNSATASYFTDEIPTTLHSNTNFNSAIRDLSYYKPNNIKVRMDVQSHPITVPETNHVFNMFDTVNRGKLNLNYNTKSSSAHSARNDVNGLETNYSHAYAAISDQYNTSYVPKLRKRNTDIKLSSITTIPALVTKEVKRTMPSEFSSIKNTNSSLEDTSDLQSTTSVNKSYHKKSLSRNLEIESVLNYLFVYEIITNY